MYRHMLSTPDSIIYSCCPLSIMIKILQNNSTSGSWSLYSGPSAHIRICIHIYVAYFCTCVASIYVRVSVFLKFLQNPIIYSSSPSSFQSLTDILSPSSSLSPHLHCLFLLLFFHHMAWAYNFHRDFNDIQLHELECQLVFPLAESPQIKPRTGPGLFRMTYAFRRT